MDKLSAVLEAGLSLDDIERMQRAGATQEEIVSAAYARLERGESLTDEPELEPQAVIKLDLNSAAGLMRMELPPVRFVVDDLLPAGLSILAAPPKFGKSWMVLDLALSVASGLTFLGYTVHQGRVLYLALEDSLQRLKSRLTLLLAGRGAPEQFDFATACRPLNEGLLDELEAYITEHPATALIVLDTFQKVRGGARRNESPYAADYRETGLLKAFADKHNIAVLLVHHLRKQLDDGDPFARISGTNGIMGAADTAIVLTREKRTDERTTLSVTGRDVEAEELVLRFEKESGAWKNLGRADDVAEQTARAEYENSAIVQTIRKLLSQYPNGWSGSAQELLDAGKYLVHRSIAGTPRELSNRLKALDQLLLSTDGILHERDRNGSGGGKHHFRYDSANPFDEIIF